MKKLTISILVALTFSFTAQAADILRPTVRTILSPFEASVWAGLLTSTTSGVDFNKEAAAILLDAEEYAQSGKLTVFLNQKILDVQANEEVSTEEAIDLLIDAAQTALSLN